MRPTNLTIPRSYYFLLFHFNEVMLLLSLTCTVLCYLACSLILKTRYVTFDTRLNLLPTHLRTNFFKSDLVFFGLHVKAYISIIEDHIVVTIYEICIDLYGFLLNVSKYLPFRFFLCYYDLIIILSSDIETHPGPRPRVYCSGFNDGFLSFCNWNVNTLTKNDFERVTCIEAHNSLYNYDIISLCETSLNNDTKVPDNILKGYHFISSDHPSGDKKGGVGIFYKETLPLKIRNDLSFDESIVVVNFWPQKNIFYCFV